jgi:hypothetical protein
MKPQFESEMEDMKKAMAKMLVAVSNAEKKTGKAITAVAKR